MNVAAERLVSPPCCQTRQPRQQDSRIEAEVASAVDLGHSDNQRMKEVLDLALGQEKDQNACPVGSGRGFLTASVPSSVSVGGQVTVVQVWVVVHAEAADHEQATPMVFGRTGLVAVLESLAFEGLRDSMVVSLERMEAEGALVIPYPN